MADIAYSHYKPAFQLGIDMLYRIRKLRSAGHSESEEFRVTVENLIMSYHIRANRVFECVEMLESKGMRLSMTNLESLLIASIATESNYSFKKLIMYFSMKKTVAAADRSESGSWGATTSSTRS